MYVWDVLKVTQNNAKQIRSEILKDKSKPLSVHTNRNYNR